MYIHMHIYNILYTIFARNALFKKLFTLQAIVHLMKGFTKNIRGGIGESAVYTPLALGLLFVCGKEKHQRRRR